MEGNKPKSFPAQAQDVQPALEKEMSPKPEYIRPGYKGSGKLEGKVALITGGDSGIGRSVAVHFAREGADVAISYMDHEQKDADETKQLIEKEGHKCLLLPGDLRNKDYCNSIVEKTVKEFGKLNVLVNNAAIQYLKPNGLEEVDDQQLEEVFDVNILSFFRVTRAALKHLHEGDAIINTTSRTAYEGSGDKIDYSSTKGAIIAFTRSLAGQLAEKKIRVNAVSSGLVWTPLIVATMEPEEVKKFGSDVPMKRAGQPSECGPAYVFLACEDSSYFTGQCLHPNGGMILNT